VWEQIRANRNRSLAVTLGMAAVLAAVGAAAGLLLAQDPLVGLGAGLVLWAALALAAYRRGDGILLGLAGARRIEKGDHPRLWNVVEEMTIAAGLPHMPAVYVVDDPSPNAFATGRDPGRSAVAVTSGLLARLDRDELQGVIGHEVGHIRNRDVLLMIMAGIMLGTIVLLADVGLRSWLWGGRLRTRASPDRGGGGRAILLAVAIVVMIAAPLMARLLYLAISRKREYLADASSVQFTRYPEGLASALEKISGSRLPLGAANRVTAPMFIVAPLTKTGREALRALGSTHPPVEARIRILRAMAGGASLADYERAYRGATGEAGVIPPSALEAGEAAGIRSPSPERLAPQTDRERAREALDTLWKLRRYAFLACTCGARIKVPPELRVDRVACPYCGASQALPSGGGPGAGVLAAARSS
jgi:heat shock protein HtpX